VVAASLGFVLSCVAPEIPSQDAEPLTVILGAKLIDGTEAEPIEDSIVVIAGSRVRHAGDRSTIRVPQNAEIVDGSGKTLMPGLVDLHVHYVGDAGEVRRQFKAQLAFGVTTARSVGVDVEENLMAIEEVRLGRASGPRRFTAGVGFAGPDAPTIVHRPSSPQEARQQVRELAGQEVDFLKLWVDSISGSRRKLSRETREAIVDEAFKYCLAPVAHIAELDDIEHLLSLGVTDFLHTVRDVEPIPARVVELLKSRRVSFAATLNVIEGFWLFPENPRLIEEDSEALAALSPEIVANLRRPEWRTERLEAVPLDILRQDFERAKRFVNQMYQAGVILTLGSDSGANLVPTGWGSHREMQLLVESGVPPLEVIRIATARSAAWLGSKQEGFGTLEPGKAADLILLDADPTENIGNTRRISRVMQAGKWIDRSSLRTH